MRRKSQKQKWVIRKLSIGVVSVGLASFLVANPAVATASEIEQGGDQQGQIVQESPDEGGVDDNSGQLDPVESNNESLNDDGAGEGANDANLPGEESQEENSPVVRLGASLGSESGDAATTDEVQTATPHYLTTEHNYYEDPSINLGTLLTSKVSELVPADYSRLVTTYGAELTEEMTVLEFWKTFGYAPEDRYYSRNNVTDQQGRIATASNRDANQTTFELPYEVYKTNVTRLIEFFGLVVGRGEAEHHVKLPGLFSRLTVGAQPNIWTEMEYNGLTFEVMENLIGYGWNGTVDDWILNPENGNNIVIPTRFNVQRDDVWLTMRGNSRDRYVSWLSGARAYLNATSVSGVQMSEEPIQVTDNISNHYYINTTTRFGITEAGFTETGDLKKDQISQGAFTTVNETLSNRLITNFNTEVNDFLTSFGEMGIDNGVGGQIQLTGLYRYSGLDHAVLNGTTISDYANYLSDQAAREADSTHITDVEYYMYSKDNQEKLYSPNKSVFTLETTRPYFTNFGNLTETVVIDLSDPATSFAKLGVDSFDLEDKGILNDGTAVTIDKSRVRVRIAVDGELSSTAFTLDQLQGELLQAKYYDKDVKLFYTYAATDASDNLLGLLPIEIVTATTTTDGGAYAVPIVRTVKLTSSFQEDHRYFTNDYGYNLATGEFEAVTSTQDIELGRTTALAEIASTSTTVANEQGYVLYHVLKLAYDENGNIVAGEVLDLDTYKTAQQVTAVDGAVKVVYFYNYERGEKAVVTVIHQTDTGVVLVPEKISEQAEKPGNGVAYLTLKDGEELTDATGKVWVFKEVSAAGDAESGTIAKEKTTVVYIYTAKEEPAVQPEPTPVIDPDKQPNLPIDTQSEDKPETLPTEVKLDGTSSLQTAASEKPVNTKEGKHLPTTGEHLSVSTSVIGGILLVFGLVGIGRKKRS